MLESGEKGHFQAIDYMTVLIMASLFHDPLDSQVPPPCTLKSAPLAKIKPFGNTGAHKCSRKNTQLSSDFRGRSSPPISWPLSSWAFTLDLYCKQATSFPKKTGLIQEQAWSFSDGITR